METNEYGVARTLRFLEDKDLHAVVAPLFEQLYQIGLGPEGIFATKQALFALEAQKDSIFLRTQQLGADLVSDLEELVQDAQSETDVAAQLSESAAATGRLLLIIVMIVSVVAAAAISFLYVGERILRRLNKLSVRMRSMAEGDLEAEVEVDDNDEIAEMANALEVFRKHALEVQRLNLVERLAEELRQKNDALEDANEDLRRAQDQLVMREKLVALGELTAGVAHEIRNPLNFIMNFSEISEELLEELIEEVTEPDKRENPDEMDSELVGENAEDLIANLKKIREHGSRANRIVDDMLKMGRDTHEFVETDINLLVDENSKLAFHSARAADTSFNLDLQYDFDSSVGNVSVVPQDLGRVVINLVSNAGYAANEKLQELREKDSNTDFIPTLLAKTERVGDRVRLTFRDNGTGMPQDVIDRIFNPFFTTKPTDKGTGLGLAICSDIIRSHGGTIEVTSEIGEWTEMVVDLPEDPSQVIDATEELNSESTDEGALDDSVD